MINSETPYKLAEIIRDTWPQLYTYNELSKKKTTRKSKETKEREEY
jgi:hypothetical protein